MAMSSIAEMEEMSPTPGRPAPLTLYQQAVSAIRTHYANMHVYPYTYLGAYYYRRRQFKQALNAWVNAANVISK